MRTLGLCCIFVWVSLIAGAGAIGTDQSQANSGPSRGIQAKIDSACNGTKRGTVYMPIGPTMDVTSLRIPSNCTVTCAHPRACTLVAAANAGDFVVFVNTSNSSLIGLVIDGNAEKQSGNSWCVHVRNGNNIRLDNNEIRKCKNYGIHFDGVSDQLWAERNYIHDTINGSAILFGYTPTSQGGTDTAVRRFHANRNTIRNIHGTADGIFTTGNGGSGYGTGPGEIVGNKLGPNIDDTAIEVGVASHDIRVENNTVDMSGSLSAPPARAGGVGISVRSAQSIRVKRNQVSGCSGIVGAIGLLIWNSAGDDPTTVRRVLFSGNKAVGCTALNSFDLLLNAGVSGSAGRGDNIRILKTRTDGGAGAYRYLSPLPTNFHRCANDDGGFCK